MRRVLSHARRRIPWMQCSCDSIVRIDKWFMHKINRGSYANCYVSRFLAMKCRRIITRSRFMKITIFFIDKDNVCVKRNCYSDRYVERTWLLWKNLKPESIYATFQPDFGRIWHRTCVWLSSNRESNKLVNANSTLTLLPYELGIGGAAFSLILFMEKFMHKSARCK